MSSDDVVIIVDDAPEASPAAQNPPVIEVVDDDDGDGAHADGRSFTGTLRKPHLTKRRMATPRNLPPEDPAPPNTTRDSGSAERRYRATESEDRAVGTAPEPADDEVQIVEMDTSMPGATKSTSASRTASGRAGVNVASNLELIWPEERTERTEDAPQSSSQLNRPSESDHRTGRSEPDRSPSQKTTNQMELEDLLGTSPTGKEGSNRGTETRVPSDSSCESLDRVLLQMENYADVAGIPLAGNSKAMRLTSRWLKVRSTSILASFYKRREEATKNGKPHLFLEDVYLRIQGRGQRQYKTVGEVLDDIKDVFISWIGHHDLDGNAREALRVYLPQFVNMAREMGRSPYEGDYHPDEGCNGGPDRGANETTPGESPLRELVRNFWTCTEREARGRRESMPEPEERRSRPVRGRRRSDTEVVRADAERARASRRPQQDLVVRRRSLPSTKHSRRVRKRGTTDEMPVDEIEHEDPSIEIADPASEELEHDVGETRRGHSLAERFGVSQVTSAEAGRGTVSAISTVDYEDIADIKIADNPEAIKVVSRWVRIPASSPLSIFYKRQAYVISDYKKRPYLEDILWKIQGETKPQYKTVGEVLDDVKASFLSWIGHCQLDGRAKQALREVFPRFVQSAREFKEHQGSSDDEFVNRVASRPSTPRETRSAGSTPVRKSKRKRAPRYYAESEDDWRI